MLSLAAAGRDQPPELKGQNECLKRQEELTLRHCRAILRQAKEEGEAVKASLELLPTTRAIELETRQVQDIPEADLEEAGGTGICRSYKGR